MRSSIALVMAMLGGAYAANGGSATRASSSGRRGARGPKGARGPVGPQGSKGDAGPAGAAGKDGTNDKDGTDGMPGSDGTTGLTETLPPEKTETGVWAGVVYEVGPIPISFDIPLAAPIGEADTKVILEGGTPPAECENRGREAGQR